MYSVKLILTIALGCALFPSVYAQVPNLEPKFGADKPVATISFEVAFPGDLAEHYVFSVESSGSAAYRSDDIGREGNNADVITRPYILKFTISQATCARIFDLAKQANYFKGNFSSVNGPVENASVTTLTYREGPPFSFSDLIPNVVNNITTYSFTTNAALQKLALIFEGISNAIEFGRRLDYQHQFDPSALNSTLKQAESGVCNYQLLELATIEKSLQDVADDPSVTDVSRASARKLLSQSPNGPATADRCRISVSRHR